MKFSLQQKKAGVALAAFMLLGSQVQLVHAMDATLEMLAQENQIQVNPIERFNTLFYNFLRHSLDKISFCWYIDQLIELVSQNRELFKKQITITFPMDRLVNKRPINTVDEYLDALLETLTTIKESVKHNSDDGLVAQGIKFIKKQIKVDEVQIGLKLKPFIPALPKKSADLYNSLKSTELATIITNRLKTP